jgi:hypothetical protein
MSHLPCCHSIALPARRRRQRNRCSCAPQTRTCARSDFFQNAKMVANAHDSGGIQLVVKRLQPRAHVASQLLQHAVGLQLTLRAVKIAKREGAGGEEAGVDGERDLSSCCGAGQLVRKALQRQCHAAQAVAHTTIAPADQPCEEAKV